MTPSTEVNDYKWYNTIFKKVLSAALLILISNIYLYAQVPTDFFLSITSQIDSVTNSTLELNNDGEISCYTHNRFDPIYAHVMNDNVASSEMTVLWNSILDNNFFSLNDVYGDPNSTLEGENIFVEVTANSVKKGISLFDQSINDINNILNTITNMLPNTCITGFNPKSFSDVDSAICPFPDQSTDSVAKNTARSGITVPNHPATAIGRTLDLIQALRKGIVKIQSKGCHTGDCVKLELAHNNVTDDEPITITLFLEFYGNNASKAIAQKIENIIERYWSNLRSDNGDIINTIVKWRIGDPYNRTPGYHYIELDEKFNRSKVNNPKKELFINQLNNFAEGQWNPNADDRVFAHEAGHLLDLPDRYLELRLNKPIGLWENPYSGIQVDFHDYASKLIRFYPPYSNSSIQELVEGLNNSPNNVQSSLPCSHDIMGTESDIINQVDINLFSGVARPIIVIVSVGDILVSQNPSLKNFVVTKTEEYFVDFNSTSTFNGIWAADFHKDMFAPTPLEGEVMDVAPNIFDWAINTQSVLEIRDILTNVNENELYCSDFQHQIDIWDLADNNDFPEIVNNGSSDGTEFIIPQSLSNSIPTLSQWVVVCLSILLLIFSVISVRQRLSLIEYNK